MKGLTHQLELSAYVYTQLIKQWRLVQLGWGVVGGRVFPGMWEALDLIVAAKPKQNKYQMSKKSGQ